MCMFEVKESIYIIFIYYLLHFITGMRRQLTWNKYQNILKKRQNILHIITYER